MEHCIGSRLAVRRRVELPVLQAFDTILGLLAFAGK
jgi:hypothetical protein